MGSFPHLVEQEVIVCEFFNENTLRFVIMFRGLAVDAIFKSSDKKTSIVVGLGAGLDFVAVAMELDAVGMEGCKGRRGVCGVGAIGLGHGDKIITTILIGVPTDNNKKAERSEF